MQLGEHGGPKSKAEPLNCSWGAPLQVTLCSALSDEIHMRGTVRMCNYAKKIFNCLV